MKMLSILVINEDIKDITEYKGSMQDINRADVVVANGRLLKHRYKIVADSVDMEKRN